MLTSEQLKEQAAVDARLAALGLPILTAAKSREYREAISAEWLAAIGYAPAKHTVVERWTGEKWIEVKLTWNGTEYKEIA
jgi:hypothetical protein